MCISVGLKNFRKHHVNKIEFEYNVEIKQQPVKGRKIFERKICVPLEMKSSICGLNALSCIY